MSGPLDRWQTLRVAEARYVLLLLIAVVVSIQRAQRRLAAGRER